MMNFENQQTQTITDFGKQWQKYQDNEGYYASVNLLSDIFSNLLDTKDLKNCQVVEIGSGSGRIVDMLLSSEVACVTAVEPSEAYEILCKNVSHAGDRVTCLQITGDALPPSGNFDYAFSIGVLHHIPNPVPVVKAAFASLQPGGRLLIWLYGKEGNRLYLAIAKIMRLFTTRLPDRALDLVVKLLDIPLVIYLSLCKIFPLPLHQYMKGHLGKLSRQNRQLTIFDQLNPAYAKYYTREEAMELMQSGGFVDLKIEPRHGYSWTLIGTKPE
ncbi:MAG: class I SAM-dependent methyltransferase [Cyanobacteria bacterium P01_E01_bin.42]